MKKIMKNISKKLGANMGKISIFAPNFFVKIVKKFSKFCLQLLMYHYLLWILIVIIFLLGIYNILRSPKTNEDKYKDHKNRRGAMMIGVSIILGAVLYYYTNIKKYHAEMLGGVQRQRPNKPSISRNQALDNCNDKLMRCDQTLANCNAEVERYHTTILPGANRLYAEHQTLKTRFDNLSRLYEENVGHIPELSDPVDDDLANLFDASKM